MRFSSIEITESIVAGFRYCRIGIDTSPSLIVIRFLLQTIG